MAWWKTYGHLNLSISTDKSNLLMKGNEVHGIRQRQNS